MNQKQAHDKLSELIRANQSTRAYDDAWWSMAMAYDRGNQWSFVQPDRGRVTVRQLRSVVDPRRADIRVTMDMIHQDVAYLKASVSPQRIAAYYEPSSGSATDRVIADLSDRIVSEHLKDIDGLSVLREMNLPRFILGSAIVRRTLEAGGATPLGDTAIRDFRVGWANCFPWEFLRDPAANTTRPERDEEILVHCKPRTVDWVKANFRIDIDTEMTMGKLLEHQRTMQAASAMTSQSGSGGARALADSNAKAVLVYEAHYRVDRQWSRTLFAYGEAGDRGDELIDINFVANPFHGLPFHFYYYDCLPNLPWGRGVPHLQMNRQDLLNLAWTWTLRNMQAGVRAVVTKDTVPLVDGQILSNRIDIPITYDPSGKPNAHVPYFMQPPAMSPAVQEILGGMPIWMRNALNLSDVHRGQTSKRGESGEAVRLKIGQADTVLEDLRRDDELTTANLLYGTLRDLTNPKWMRLDTIRDIAGRDVPDEHVRLLVREGTSQAVRRAVVLESTMRPKTPAETQDQFLTLVERQVKTAEDAEWEMNTEGRLKTNTAMRNAFRKQMTEMDRMIAGAEIAPAMTDHHTWHYRTIREHADRPEWHSLPPDAQDRILEHAAAHREAMMLLGEGEMAAGMNAASAPSPPSGPAGGSSAVGAVGPAMNVA